MKQKYDINAMSENNNEQNDAVEALPSRRSRHPKPLSFLEKPAFSLIVFILFILILGGIFIYFTYIKDQSNNDKEMSSNFATTENNHNHTDDVKTPPKVIEIDNTQQQKPIPVVNTSDLPLEELVDETKTVADDPKDESINVITHKVVSGDNLYQISKKYYGSSNQDYINKIMEANNLKDNNILLDSILVIPDPIRNP